MSAPHAARRLFVAEDLLLPPNLVSLLRLPLAALFPLAARSKRTAVGVLMLAAATDVLDGWLARTRGQQTATGAVLDPIVDKVFALSAMGTLVARGALPRWGVGALLAREALEAPLLAWALFAGRPTNGEDMTEVRAGVAGKVATTAQFLAVFAAIEAPSLLPAVLGTAAITGLVAGVMYWRREMAWAARASLTYRTDSPGPRADGRASEAGDERRQ